MPDTDIYDVIQIGYGPVGQVMSALLGKRGHRVAVFERWPDLYGQARAGHFDHEIMRVFQSIGAAEAVEEDAYRADQYVFKNGHDETLMTFDWHTDGISGWPSDYIMYQPSVEDALDAAVRAQRSVELHQGWEVTGFTQHEDFVEVTVRRVGRSGVGKKILTDETRTVRGRYLVAADGANSFTREQLGIGQKDFGFRESWLVCDLEPISPLHFDFDNGQVCDPARPHCLFQLGKSHRRFEFSLLPGEDIERMFTTDIAWKLMEPYDVTPANAKLVRHAVYTFESKLAERWQDGRIFLAGDAVHLMPPFMGQGMCSGIRDATNLAWRLDLVLRGVVGPDVFDTYQTERALHAGALVEMSIMAGAVSCTFDPAVAEERDEKFRSGQVPPPPPFPHLTGGLLADPADPLAGRLAPQGRVRLDAHVGRFDDVHGGGWTLLSLTSLCAVLGAEQQDLLAKLDARMVTLDDEVDIDGYYRDYFASNGVAAVLYRPDFYIFGSAAGLADVNGLVNRLSAQLPVLIAEPATA